MARRLDILINEVRRMTENVEYDSNIGIPQEEFIQYFNDAQDRIQALINAQHPNVFLTEYTTSVTDGVESYDIPENAFLNNRVYSVEFRTSTGNGQEFWRLPQATSRTRRSQTRSVPVYYMQRDGKVFLTPVPDSSAAELRITYVRRLNDVDLRRGKITSRTLTGSTLTAIITDDTGGTHDTNLAEHDYISVVDKYGTVKIAKLPITSIALGVVTLPSYTLASGEGISVGDYIVGGSYTTTHSELPDNVERYLIAYVAWKIFKRDSSDDAKRQEQELMAMEQDIVESYAEITDDIITIPISNYWEL